MNYIWMRHDSDPARQGSQTGDWMVGQQLIKHQQDASLNPILI